MDAIVGQLPSGHPARANTTHKRHTQCCRLPTRTKNNNNLHKPNSYAIEESGGNRHIRGSSHFAAYDRVVSDASRGHGRWREDEATGGVAGEVDDEDGTSDNCVAVVVVVVVVARERGL
jgi:hypothetical protein